MTLTRRCTNEEASVAECARCGGIAGYDCTDCLGAGKIIEPCPEVGILVQIQTERDATGTWAKNDADLNCRTCGKELSDE